MNHIEKRVEQLSTRLDDLVKEFVQNRKEIREISQELVKIKQYLRQHPNLKAIQEKPVQQLEQKIVEVEKETELSDPSIPPALDPSVPISSDPSVPSSLDSSVPPSPDPSVPPSPKRASSSMGNNLEAFIGGNLLNKIGILAIILGVGIGTKYAIDNNYISPLVRVILGYLVGFGLLVFAIRLKPKYESFSAVLLGGAMSVMYFMTYAAHSFYQLFPSLFAFILMVFFTVCTVVAALQYKRQVIAILGMVGAYAVPFLIGSESDSAFTLLMYVTIINIGIAITAFYQNWKLLYYLAFVFTWGIYFIWMDSLSFGESMGMGLTFATIFFLTFYACALAHKLINKEKLAWQDIILILVNSCIYYGIGMVFLDSADYRAYRGLFTLFNALLHFIVGVLIYRTKLADKNLFYLVAGLVITFLTIAIPVQLEGSWVTLLWAIEAMLLFGIGRMRQVKIYEWISYPVIFLSFLSLLVNWGEQYAPYLDAVDGGTTLRFLLNPYFLQSMLVAAAFGVLAYLNFKQPQRKLAIENGVGVLLPDLLIPFLLLMTTYFGGLMELICMIDEVYKDSAITKLSSSGNPYFNYNAAITYMGFAIVVIYNLLFQTGITAVLAKKMQYYIPANIMIVLNLLVIGGLILLGPAAIFNELVDYYEQYESEGPFAVSIWYIAIRYIVYGVATILFLVTVYLGRQAFMQQGKWSKVLEFVGLLFVFMMLNQEFIHWEIQRYGLTILWGTFALFLLGYGFGFAKKHLRMSGIILFGLTVFKLVFYDMAQMPTITKTLTFIGLGVLLLIGSFLYNKFADQLIEEDKKIEHEQV